MYNLSQPETGQSCVAPYTVLYGQAGIGKTTFAAMPPGTVFANIDKGIPEVLAQVPRFNVDTLPEMIGLLKQLTDQPHNFQHVVIDTVTALNQRLIEQVCTEQRWRLPDGSPDMGEKGYGSYGRGEKAVSEKHAAVVGEILRLKEKRNIAVTALAHVRVVKVRPPDGEEYARYDLALPAGAIETYGQRADIVGFMQYPVTLLRAASGQARAISNENPRIYLRGTAAYHAKNRFGLPDYIEVPQGNPGAAFVDFASRIPYFSRAISPPASAPRAA